LVVSETDVDRRLHPWASRTGQAHLQQSVTGYAEVPIRSFDEGLTKMQVGIDCLRLDPSYVGGINTFVLRLVDSLLRVAPASTFHLYVTDANWKIFERLSSAPNGKLELACRGAAIRAFLWRVSSFAGARDFHRVAANSLFSEARRQMETQCDVVYTPCTLLSAYNYRKPTMLSMHDIQHVHFPHFFDPLRRVSRRLTYQLSAENAACIQASSRFMRDDFLRHFTHLCPEQVVIIPEGVEIEHYSTPVPKNVLAKYRLPEKFLFYPAQLWLHKNHVTVLKALKRIERTHHIKMPLVLTGARLSGARAVFRYIAEEQMDYVHYLGTVPFKEIVALYQSATLVIAAGIYESSCLPILEAAAAGTPVIASSIPPNEEFSESLRLNLFETMNDEELARLLLCTWHDCDLRQTQAAANRHAVQRYSWDNAAKRYMSCLAHLGELSR
jgi:glycosyltransferase involved in cell wall biosynthesis